MSPGDLSDCHHVGRIATSERLIGVAENYRTEWPDSPECAPACAALLAQRRDAENRGFDVDTELPMLVTGRSFDDTDDVTSVLHHRIDRYVTGVGYPSPPASELVAGIFPRPSGIEDPDIVFALNDRADAIEQRARELATIGIERGDAWV